MLAYTNGQYIIIYIELNNLSRYSTARHVLNQKNEAFDYVINRLLLMSPYLVECADVDSSTKRYMLGM